MQLASEKSDQYWMQEAIVQAECAAQANEIPVGAVLVLDDKVIGQGWNKPISESNPVAHAEILALQQGANFLSNYRLLGCTLYVTLEPCSMCVGAIIHSRIRRLVFGAYDEKTGAVHSQINLLSAEFHNHRVEVEGGIMQEKCAELLKNFFSQLRSKRKDKKK